MSLLAGTVLSRFRDDKFQLLMLAGARLPRNVVQPVARSVIRFAPRRFNASRVLALKLAGKPKEAIALADAVQGAVDSSPRAASRLADVLTSMGESDRAAQIIGAAAERIGAGEANRYIAASTARLRWNLGDMSGAIDALDTSHASTPWSKRLEDELALFQGWEPDLATVRDYRPNKRTVLHVLTNSLPFTSSGYALRSHEVLRALAENGSDVHAVTRLGYPAVVGKIARHRQEEFDGVTYHRLLPHVQPGLQSQRLQEQAELLLKLCLKLRPALLHTTTHFVNAIMVKSVAEALNIPWVYEVRGFLADTWASSRSESAVLSERYRLFQEREGEAARAADAVITLGPAMAAEIVRWGVPTSAVSIRPNAIRVQDLGEDLTQREAREQLGLELEKTYVGTVSSLVPYEGIDTLVTAMVDVVARDKDVRLLIVGDGLARDALVQLAADLGIAKYCLFPGRVPSEGAKLYYRALDLFVIPRKDTRVTRLVTPLKPLQARAVGLRVIGSDLPALAELGKQNLFEAGNSQALSEKIVEALARPGKLRRDAPPTWNDGAVQTLKLYEELTKARDE